MDAVREGGTVIVVTPAIEKLLILQERDGRRLGFEQMLSRLPREVQEAEKKIAEEKEALATISLSLKEMEVKRSELDAEIKDREEKIRKYKNQQLAVKKNDEYQALSHEIESLEGQVGELEEKEIALMLEIDEAKEKAATESAEHEKLIKLYEGEIATLKEREGNLNTDLTKAQEETSAAEGDIPDPVFKAHYLQIRERGVKFPLVVPFEYQKCGGCHLKVSGEVVTIVHHQKEPAHCNNCSRILYLD